MKRSCRIGVIAFLLTGSLWFSPWPGRNCCAAPGAGSEPPAVTEDLFFEEIPVVYAASKRIQSAREAPASVSVVTEEDIRRFGYRTVGDALRSLAGFHVSWDRNYDKVGVGGVWIPGDYNTRILILVDGHAVNEQWSGSSGVDRSLGIPIELVHRIEVVRGPASTMYGTDAFLAVVNIVTRQESLLEGTEVTGELGSFDSRGATVTSGYELAGGWQWVGAASVFQSDGDDRLSFTFPDDPARNGVPVDGVDYERAYQAFSSLRYKGFSVFGQYGTRKKGLPTAPYDADFGDDENYTLDRRAFVDVSQSVSPWENLSLRGRMFFDFYRFEDNLKYSGEGTWKDLGEDLWWGGELMVQARLFGGNELVAGFEYSDHDLEDASFYIAEGPNSADYSFHVYSFYLEDAWQVFEKLRAIAGFRYDKNSLYEGQFSPRAGVLVFPRPGTTLKLLYSEAFRSPSIYERFFDDGTDFAANPAIEPERVRSVTFTVEQEVFPGVTASATYVHNRLEDLIVQVYNGGLDRFQYQNALDIETDGVQIGLEGQTVWGLRGFANLSYQDARDGSGKDRLANSPKLLANAGLSVPLWRQKVFFSPLIHFVDSRYTVDRSQKVSDYLRADLTLSAQKLWKGLSASFSVYNLYDIRYDDPVNQENSVLRMRQDGRAFWLRLAYEF